MSACPGLSYSELRKDTMAALCFIKPGDRSYWLYLGPVGAATTHRDRVCPGFKVMRQMYSERTHRMGMHRLGVIDVSGK